jgi:hypothetical protein
VPSTNHSCRYPCVAHDTYQPSSPPHESLFGRHFCRRFTTRVPDSNRCPMRFRRSRNPYLGMEGMVQFKFLALVSGRNRRLTRVPSAKPQRQCRKPPTQAEGMPIFLACKILSRVLHLNPPPAPLYSARGCPSVHDHFRALRRTCGAPRQPEDWIFCVSTQKPGAIWRGSGGAASGGRGIPQRRRMGAAGRVR